LNLIKRAVQVWHETSLLVVGADIASTYTKRFLKIFFANAVITWYFLSVLSIQFRISRWRRKKLTMIKTSSFIAGRVYSIIYNSAVEMVRVRALEFGRIQELARAGIALEKTENGKCINPLDGALVAVRRVSTIQAAGEKTWENYKRKAGIVTESAQPWWTVTPENSCVVAHNKTGVEYLRGLPRGITLEQYMVNGIHATPLQIETIGAFKKNQSNGPADFVLLTLDKLENVDSGTDESE
jgi:hypothetical protein